MAVRPLDVDPSQLEAICRQYGITRLEVFGSTARHEDTAASDVDLLYELDAGRELGWEITDAEAALAKVFGRNVDLVSKRSLHAALRPQVLADAVVLYAA